MNHSISINTAQQINLFDFNDHDDKLKPTFTYHQQLIFDALEEAGSTGLTTQELKRLCNTPAADIKRLREKGVNIVSIDRGPVFDPDRGCVVNNTIRYVLGSPRFISPPSAATLH